MIIGITGARGNLGSSFIKKYKNIHQFNIFKGDISKKKHIDDWLKNSKIDCLIHAAGVVAINEVNRNKKKAYNINVNGTKKLVNSINKYSKKIYFVFLSSAHVYEIKKNKAKETEKLKPISAYGHQKILSEKYIKNNLINKFSILRVFSFTSPKQKKSFFIPAKLKKIKSNKNEIHREIKYLQKRDFIHIEDLCEVLNFFITNQKVGIFNVGSGNAINLYKIISYFCKKFKKKLIYDRHLGQNLNLIPNISKLKRAGFKKKFKKINKILSDFI